MLALKTIVLVVALAVRLAIGDAQWALRVTTTLAGDPSSVGGYIDGIGTTSARFDWPNGVSFSPDGSTVLVADNYNYTIRSIAFDSGETTTLAGGGIRRRDGRHRHDRRTI